MPISAIFERKIAIFHHVLSKNLPIFSPVLANIIPTARSGRTGGAPRTSSRALARPAFSARIRGFEGARAPNFFKWVFRQKIFPRFEFCFAVFFVVVPVKKKCRK
jgi:hypothetical protein